MEMEKRTDAYDIDVDAFTDADFGDEGDNDDGGFTLAEPLPVLPKAASKEKEPVNRSAMAASYGLAGIVVSDDTGVARNVDLLVALNALTRDERVKFFTWTKTEGAESFRVNEANLLTDPAEYRWLRSNYTSERAARRKTLYAAATTYLNRNNMKQVPYSSADGRELEALTALNGAVQARDLTNPAMAAVGISIIERAFQEACPTEAEGCVASFESPAAIAAISYVNATVGLVNGSAIASVTLRATAKHPDIVNHLVRSGLAFRDIQQKKEFDITTQLAEIKMDLKHGNLTAIEVLAIILQGPHFVNFLKDFPKPDAAEFKSHLSILGANYRQDVPASIHKAVKESFDKDRDSQQAYVKGLNNIARQLKDLSEANRHTRAPITEADKYTKKLMDVTNARVTSELLDYERAIQKFASKNYNIIHYNYNPHGAVYATRLLRKYFPEAQLNYYADTADAANVVKEFQEDCELRKPMANQRILVMHGTLDAKIADCRKKSGATDGIEPRVLLGTDEEKRHLLLFCRPLLHYHYGAKDVDKKTPLATWANLDANLRRQTFFFQLAKTCRVDICFPFFFGLAPHSRPSDLVIAAQRQKQSKLGNLDLVYSSRLHHPYALLCVGAAVEISVPHLIMKIATAMKIATLAERARMVYFKDGFNFIDQLISAREELFRKDNEMHEYKCVDVVYSKLDVKRVSRTTPREILISTGDVELDEIEFRDLPRDPDFDI